MCYLRKNESLKIPIKFLEISGVNVLAQTFFDHFSDNYMALRVLYTLTKKHIWSFIANFLRLTPSPLSAWGAPEPKLYSYFMTLGCHVKVCEHGLHGAPLETQDFSAGPAGCSHFNPLHPVHILLRPLQTLPL
jgi:hypothetical protein